MLDKASQSGAQGVANDYSFHADTPDIGVSWDEAHGIRPDAGHYVKAAVRAALANQSVWSGLDHENYINNYVRQDRRTGRGQFALEAVLEFLVEEQGYPIREAMDALVLEAVRVAANANGADIRKRMAAKKAVR